MFRVRINTVQHTQCSNTTSMTQRQETLVSAKPGHRIPHGAQKFIMTFRSRLHTGTILKDQENKCIVATKQHKGVHKDTIYQPLNTNSLRDTRDNTTHAYVVFEGELAVKLHTIEECQDWN